MPEPKMLIFFRKIASCDPPGRHIYPIICHFIQNFGYKWMRETSRLGPLENPKIPTGIQYFGFDID